MQPVVGFISPQLSSYGSQFQRSANRNNCLFALERAKEVFDKYSVKGSDGISSNDLANMLHSLDVDASQEEANALFRYLDTDGDGSITLEEFLPWYSATADAAREVSSSFQSLLTGR